MKFRGKVHKLGDDINTDYIIASKHKSKILDMKELSKHLMEDIAPDFFKRLSKGDFIVAGENFGCGSARETAPRVIVAANISAIIAKSFARIFYRNAINVGLPVAECNTDLITEGEIIELDLKRGVVETPSGVIKIRPLPEIMLKLLSEGGVIKHFKKYKDFNL